MIQLQILVSGKVQGVGYRYYAQMKAIQYGINGWVMNQGDDAVKIVATGTKADLEQYMEELRRGNPFSRVDRLEYHECEHHDDWQSFTIKY
ncbi:acylphosphatase [Bacillus massilinigeriensis]|uniref:acylphosphatase n=1 Tax=Bacillus mediterraneensis TaxID=1805474 RepID=UPI0008F8BBCD|nr:acylphosphatase [Bacillus mediterraneensis]